MDLLLIFMMSFVIGYFVFKKQKEWKILPPGPTGLPIFGYLPFINAKEPHITFMKLAQTFGPIFSIKMGNVLAVVLSDHKIIREAFSKEVFSGRAPLFLTHGIMNGNGIICAEGALWKDQRKLVTTWMKSFGMAKYGATRKELEKRIAAGASDLVRDLETASNRLEEVDINQLITDSVGNVVNDLVFGFKFPPGDQTWQWLRSIQEEGCHEMGVAAIVNFLPFLRFFSKSIRNTMKILVRGQAQTHRMYASIIARRRKMLDLKAPVGSEYELTGSFDEKHPKGWTKCVKYSKHSSTMEYHYFDSDVLIHTSEDCILDKFLLEQKQRYEEDNNKEFVTDKQLVFLLADLFGAGLDTTAVTLSWLILYMALNQEIQDDIRRELFEVYPEEDGWDSSELPKLMAAVCETQRIRSIVPVGIPHGTLQDTYLDGFYIPAGTMIVPLQWAVHMDPCVWEEPDQFMPSRFLDADGALLKPQEFIPFQSGKRMCPGDELSRMLVCVMAGKLLRRWRISCAKLPTEEELKGTVGVTLTPPAVKYLCERIL